MGYVGKDCSSSQKKLCCYCGRKGSHNRCLSPQKLTRQEIENFIAKECSESSENTTTTTTHTKPVKENDQSTDIVDSNAIQCCWPLEREHIVADSNCSNTKGWMD